MSLTQAVGTAFRDAGLPVAESWQDRLARLLTNELTTDERRCAYYRQFAGTYPGPNRALIAAMLAFRAVEMEKREGSK